MTGDKQQIDTSDWSVPEFNQTTFRSKKSDYCLVIPVINEGERIRAQIKRIRDCDLNIDTIIADGGSTDGSLHADYLTEQNMRALLVKTGPGELSAQLRMAYSWALKEGYQGIVTIDGNGKDGVAAIAEFSQKLSEGYDYIQGSRYCAGGEALNTPKFRWFAGRFIHAPIISLVSGHWFTDTTNGFRAYSRRFLLDPKVAPFRAEFMRYNLLFYLSVRAPQLGYRVTELPVRRAYPASGKVPTKIKGLKGPMDLMRELLAVAVGQYHP